MAIVTFLSGRVCAFGELAASSPVATTSAASTRPNFRGPEAARRLNVFDSMTSPSVSVEFTESYHRQKTHKNILFRKICSQDWNIPAMRVGVWRPVPAEREGLPSGCRPPYRL